MNMDREAKAQLDMEMEAELVSAYRDECAGVAMPSAVLTASLCGLDTELVRVETDLANGLPALYLVGLPSLTVKESKERIRSAITNAGYRFPQRRITVNLSPADTRKEGSHFDLPMAVGVLAASEGLPPSALLHTAFLGELSLDGKVCRAEIGLALIIGLKERGIRNLFLPEGNMEEALAVGEMAYYPVSHLSQVVGHLSGESPIAPVHTSLLSAEEITETLSSDWGDYGEVKGQEAAKRALQICAAGGHDVALCGAPGVGKSMLAERIPSILPPLSREEALEVTKIYNIAGRNPWAGKLMNERPFRAPHHAAPPTALVGGGARPIPGELSLAHRGVLFLDELPEFERRTLDMLRQPLEDGFIDLSRAGYRNRYPCQFILITAMNPCPCGYYGDPFHECSCKPWQRQRYQSRVSGPLLDRIDIHVSVNRVAFGDLYEDSNCMTSAKLREGVLLATERQKARYEKGEISRNAQLTADLMEHHCRLKGDAEKLLASAYRAYGLSARQGKKVVKLARTIADLEDCADIKAEHVAEAIGLRRKEEEGENVSEG
jgi:magnesium chelatase family protein